MPAFIVAYDMHQPDPDYDRLIKRVNEMYQDNCHLQLSVWIVVADATATEIRDKFSAQLTGKDSFFVSQLGDDWSWQGYPQKVRNWLSANL